MINSHINNSYSNNEILRIVYGPYEGYIADCFINNELNRGNNCPNPGYAIEGVELIVRLAAIKFEYVNAVIVNNKWLESMFDTIDQQANSCTVPYFARTPARLQRFLATGNIFQVYTLVLRKIIFYAIYNYLLLNCRNRPQCSTQQRTLATEQQVDY